MTKQIKFETEDEILGAINESSRAMKAAEQAGLLHRKMADKFTKDANKHSNGEASILIERADEELRKSAAMIRRAERIERRLRQYKDALAAFRTRTFPFSPDQSVVVDK